MRTRLALAVLCTLAGAAHADLATGRDKLIAGDYKTAIAELSKVSGKDRPAARLLLARAQMETGDYAAAEVTASAIKDIDGRLLLDELRFMTGRGPDARKDLEE